MYFIHKKSPRSTTTNKVIKQGPSFQQKTPLPGSMSKYEQSRFNTYFIRLWQHTLLSFTVLPLDSTPFR